MTDAIQVEGLRFAYAPLSPGDPPQWVIDGLNLHVSEGEWLAVMGASDAGKTTLCLLLAGLAPQLTGGKREGRILVAGQDTLLKPPPALASTVGLLFQEPESQLFNPTVETEVAWGLENLGLPASEIQARLDEALSALSLSHLRTRFPGELSGGEKKRLALASVLAMRPSVLLLDEPMGGLDPVGRGEVLAALSELRRDRRVTIIMTESDPEAVATFADRLVILKQGQIVLEGPPRMLFQRVEQLMSLGVAVPDLARLAAALNGRLGTRFDFLTIEEARAALLAFEPGEPALETRTTDLGRGTWTAEEAQDGSACLQTAGLAFWYADERVPVLHDLDLSIRPGQLTALIGANGSGKTTLVKHFNGLLRPRRGIVWVFGQDAAQHSVGDLARRVGYLFQHPEQQIFSHTVRREVSFGPRNLGLSAPVVEDRTVAALARFGLLGVADSPPAIMSYGIRRRVTLASLAAMEPPVVVLDEPTVGLDALGRRELAGWLDELRSGGRTIILVSHDMTLVAEHAERAIVLRQGQILADGVPAHLFQHPEMLARASLAPPPIAELAIELSQYGMTSGAQTVEALADRYVAILGGRP